MISSESLPSSATPTERSREEMLKIPFQLPVLGTRRQEPVHLVGDKRQLATAFFFIFGFSQLLSRLQDVVGVDARPAVEAVPHEGRQVEE